MRKTVGVTILSLLIIAGCAVGMYFITKDTDVPAAPETVQINSTEEATVLIDTTEADIETEASFIDSQSETANTPDDPIDDNTTELYTSNFRIISIIDHTTNETVSPRVVFGSSYNPSDFYIVFDSDGTFKLKLDSYAEKAPRSGKYTDYGDIIYVVYDDGKGSEYDVSHNDEGIITQIKVNFGDYDIYFA